MTCLVPPDLFRVLAYHGVAEADGVSAGNLPARSGAGGHVVGKPRAGCRVEVELGFEVFEVEGEVQDCLVTWPVRGLPGVRRVHHRLLCWSSGDSALRDAASLMNSLTMEVDLR